jgi:DNA invertase Pin-like site-specific DNA recombinase
MLKDAVRRLFDVLMVWSIDRLGRSAMRLTGGERTAEAVLLNLLARRPIGTVKLPRLLSDGHDLLLCI